MEIEYQHEPRDVEAWWLYTSRRNGGHRLANWANVVALAGGGAWATSKFGSDPLSTNLFGLGGLLAGWGLAAATTRLWVHAAAQASARGAAQKQFGPHRLLVGPEGILERGPVATHSHAWSAVEGLFETGEHLFVGIAGGSAYVVPKRNLAPESAASLKATVGSYMEAERRRTTG
jgi:hypothetical protein